MNDRDHRIWETILSINTWTHIAAVKSGTSINFYINGNFYSTVDEGVHINDSDGNLRIGMNGSAYGPCHWEGAIDEVRFWNRARTESEIKSDLNKTLTGSETGLIGYWPFSESIGDTVYDKTVNANHGTLHGGVTWIRTSLNM